jgi:hypothetical protein
MRVPSSVAPPDPRPAAVSVRAPASKVPPTAPIASAPWAQFAAVVVQLALLVLVVRGFGLEGDRLGDVLVLAAAGFIIHHFLPARFRLPFFALLSFAGIQVAFGTALAMRVIGLGLLLIAICHLPIAFKLRVVLLLLLGGGLAAVRRGSFWFPGVNTATVVILTSFFMFRLIVYLYDLRHRTAPFGFWRALAYFFMLPNAVFLLFPVVDYKTFCTTYATGDRFTVYQRGLRWMLRGVVQLILYRLVYKLLQVDPLDVTDLTGVLRFMVATFLLYLKVSGTFHLAVGLLHLFGFALPEANHRYLLSRSFLDLWRRINIYWKDFILKNFFNPAYFRLKRLGPTGALVLATLYAFFWTWLLHSYQTFWITGKEKFSSWQEGAFWAALGLLVLGSALYEARGGRRRAAARVSFRSELGRALCTITTMVTLVVLWTFWTCQSTDELTWLLEAAQHVTLASLVAIVAGLALLGGAAVVLGRSTAEPGGTATAPLVSDRSMFWLWAGAVSLAASGLLLLNILPAWRPVQGTMAGDVLTVMQAEGINQTDMDAVRRGYYEELDVARLDSDIKAAVQPRQRWPIRQYHRMTNEFMVHEAIPGRSLAVEGKPVTINRWGMRDHDYAMAKPPGVFRIVLLGSSAEAGHGVGDNDTFKALLEDRLNREDTGGTFRKYEILNFSVAGYGGYQKLALLERTALSLDPDLVLFVTYLAETERTAYHVAQLVQAQYNIPEEYQGPIRAAIEKAHVDPSMPFPRIERRLKPYSMDLVTAVYERLAHVCHAHGIRAAFVYRPQTGEQPRLVAGERERLLDVARRTGLPVLNLSAAYDGVTDRGSLMVAPYSAYHFAQLAREAFDDHPNELGHRLLADELYRQLHTDEGLLLIRPRNKP